MASGGGPTHLPVCYILAGAGCVRLQRRHPTSGAGTLESITREVAKQLLEQELQIPVIERDMDRTELYVADEAFLCGTAVEVQPIVSVDRCQVGDGAPGPVVSRLEELFHRIVRAEDERYVKWCTPVYGDRGYYLDSCVIISTDPCKTVCHKSPPPY